MSTNRYVKKGIELNFRKPSLSRLAQQEKFSQKILASMIPFCSKSKKIE
jgi:hypothetical protein